MELEMMEHIPVKSYWHSRSPCSEQTRRENHSRRRTHSDESVVQTFSRWIWVSRYQNVSILNVIEYKDDRGDGNKRSCKTCKAANLMTQTWTGVSSPSAWNTSSKEYELNVVNAWILLVTDDSRCLHHVTDCGWFSVKMWRVLCGDRQIQL